MQDYTVSYGGHGISIRCSDEASYLFTSFLLQHLPVNPPVTDTPTLTIAHTDTHDLYDLNINHTRLCRAPLGVMLAAKLYDAILFSLLNTNTSGLALHSGAVNYLDKGILLPGKSGAGKTTLTAWLTHLGATYLTDELVFFPIEHPEKGIPFTRPLSCKPGAVETVLALIQDKVSRRLCIHDDHGLIIDYTLLHNRPAEACFYPELILFPAYTPGADLRVENISAAQACSLLMACDVNGRNLPGHGFRQAAELSRAIPSYRISYGNLNTLPMVLYKLWTKLNWATP